MAISSALSNVSLAQGIEGEMTFEQTCLTDINDPNSQNMSVDERNRIHLSRIDPGTRQLIYTQLISGQEPLREIIANPLDLEIDPVNDTDIIARHDQVYICTYRSTQMTRVLSVFIRNQEGTWREEVIESNGGGGGECEFAWVDNTLNVASERNGVIYWYTRGPDSWTHQALTPNGQSQGFDLRITITESDDILLTHRSFDYQSLFLTQRRGGIWSTNAITEFEPLQLAMAGVRPQAIKWADGLVWIFHGSRNGETQLDFAADGDALVTESPEQGDHFTFYWSNTSGLGGINAAKILSGPDGEEEGYFLTRELIRNPVTGNRYGLRLHRFTRDYSLDEYYQLQQSIPGFPNFHLEPEIQVDPAGLPVLAHIDKAIAETRSCIWRLADRDGDGLPDEGETRLGTDLNVPDTDGDGRSDGLEVQEGTNPLVNDGANPLSWLPELLPFDDEMMAGTDIAGTDMAGADMAGTDMAGTDMAGTDMAGTDMAGTDMAGTDMAGTDMAGTDMAGTDMAGTDMAGTDMAGTDMAGTDMAGTDMAGTDMAGTDMAGTDMAGTDMAGTDMAGTDMAGTDMAGTDMAGTDMAGTDMAGTDMAGTDMAGTDMAGTDMAGTDMAGTDMAGADMAGADMAGTDMAGTDMVGADMAGADMAGTDMAGTDMAGTDMAGTDMAGTDMADGGESMFAGDRSAFAGESLDEENRGMNSASQEGCQQQPQPFSSPWIVFMILAAFSGFRLTATRLRDE